MTIEELITRVTAKSQPSAYAAVGRIVIATLAEVDMVVDEATGEIRAKPAQAPYQPLEQRNVRYAGMRTKNQPQRFSKRRNQP